ncbi:MAG: tetratricopeptide repeat protein [Acidobacteriota bacterium]|nr:tetratricopeptide repeat protein [Acidobacteriota bacterium]
MQKRILFLACAAVAFSQTPPAAIDPAYAELDKAYQELKARKYDNAIAGFERAITLAPDRPSVRKDLAYTLLKVGETAAARDQFAAAMRLDPGDDQVALEYAFLCYETHQEVAARRIFDRYRKSSATAAQAFENIDRPLREGIERWRQALVASPDNFSGHLELAHLAEQRDEVPLAAEHYERAWHLRPDHRDLLLDLGRVWKQLDRAEEAGAALLAASRGAEPRVAEQARELLPDRYPYVYEFEKALALDPANVELRREFAYLQLQMEHRNDAASQFAGIVERAPADLSSVAQLGLLKLSQGEGTGAMALLNRVLSGGDEELAERVRTALHLPETLRARAAVAPGVVPNQAKELAFKSLEKGYLKDALRYLTIAHENDPVDFEVMLKLGWANNMLKDDRDAIKWFNLARQSPDVKIAVEAARASHNLAGSLARFRSTVWVFPTFSTRWHDLFAYAQAKTEWNLQGWFVHPYATLRFVGDTQGAIAPGVGFAPQYLSEGAAILGLGMATRTWHGATGWLEAGEEVRYRTTSTDPSRASPDYRGGVSYAKGWGHLLTGESHGWFAETNDDAVYVRRFENDTLLYAQNRTGYTAPHAQFYWNWNVTTDVKTLYWANYVETGPGLRFRLPGRVAPLLFSINLLRGAYLINAGNPRGPNFNDLRMGVWYAFSR